jgi:DHA2 family multidrug resistance protein
MLRYVDSRVLCATGLAIFGFSCLLNGVTFTHDTGGDQLMWSQIIRAMGQPLLMSPLSQMATVGIAPAQAGGASALFNMMRNLGGSVGIAMMSTMASQRETYHFSMISDHMSVNNPHVNAWLGQVGQRFATLGGNGSQQALAQLAKMVRREAFVMAYADCFFVVGCLLLLATLGCLFLQPVKPGGGGGAAH